MKSTCISYTVSAAHTFLVDLADCNTSGTTSFELYSDVSYPRFLLGGSAGCDVFRYDSAERDSLVIQNRIIKGYIPVNKDWDTVEVETWWARSVYVQDCGNGNKEYWHLHPELKKIPE